MEAIEKATGKSITRIETTDLDVMEEVRTYRRLPAFTAPHASVWCTTANEEGDEVAFLLFIPEGLESKSGSRNPIFNVVADVLKACSTGKFTPYRHITCISSSCAFPSGMRSIVRYPGAHFAQLAHANLLRPAESVANVVTTGCLARSYPLG
jgi:hypothetical protein